MGIRGTVKKIYDAINAAYFVVDDHDAESLRKDPRVLRVERNRIGHISTAQNSPGWALDRLDQSSPSLNSQYFYGSNGAGQTIYILDTGLNTGNPKIISEFGSRA
jgi:hypothetical protein